MNRRTPFSLLLALALGAPMMAVPALQAQTNEVMLSLEDLLTTPVSTAAKHDQLAEDAPASVTVIPRSDLVSHGYRTLAEALVNVPGFYGTYDRNYFYLGTRGFSRPTDYNNRVLLLVDGHRMNEEFYGSAYLGTDFGLSLDAVDRIEVVRGPGSALYGGSAMFAVVNVITRQGRALVGSEASGSVGSAGLKGGQFTWGTLSDAGVDVMVSGNVFNESGRDLYFPEFDTPETNQGFVTGHDGDQGGGVIGKVTFKGFRALFFGSRREKAVPTAPYETLFNQDVSTIDRRYALELSGDLGAGENGVLSLRLSADRGVYDGRWAYDDPYSQRERSVVAWYGGEARLRLDLSSSLRLVTGIEGWHTPTASYYVEDDTGPITDGDWGFGAVSAFAQQEWQVTKDVALTAGARADRIDGRSALSPRLAAVAHPTERTTLKLLYGEAFRPPNRYELYYDVPDESKANPDLLPESIRTLELVLEQRLSEQTWATMSLFDFSVRDLIDGVVDEIDELYVFKNQGQMAVRGGELEVSGRFGSGGHAFASFYALQPTLNDDSAEPVANAPTHGARFGASRHFTRPGVTMAVDGQYDGERLSAYGEPVSGYVVSNLTFTLPELLDRMRLSVAVRNLFNTDYMTPAGFEHVQSAIRQDGRHLRASLRFTF